MSLIWGDYIVFVKAATKNNKILSLHMHHHHHHHHTSWMKILIWLLGQMYRFLIEHIWDYADALKCLDLQPRVNPVWKGLTVIFFIIWKHENAKWERWEMFFKGCLKRAFPQVFSVYPGLCSCHNGKLALAFSSSWGTKTLLWQPGSLNFF